MACWLQIIRAVQHFDHFYDFGSTAFLGAEAPLQTIVRVFLWCAVGVFWLAIPLVAQVKHPRAQEGREWRRTTAGWELKSRWSDRVETSVLPPITGIHPGVIASLQLLTSAAALLAFSSSKRQE